MAISKSIARLAQQRKPSAVDEKPGCAFGMVTRKGLEDLSRDFERLEMKINGIMFGVLVAVGLEIWRAVR